MYIEAVSDRQVHHRKWASVSHEWRNPCSSWSAPCHKRMVHDDVWKQHKITGDSHNSNILHCGISARDVLFSETEC